MKEKKDNRATVKSARINSKGVIIAAIITTLGLFLSYFFLKTENSDENTYSTNSQKVVSKDSSSQHFVNQQNSNNGNVNNEYIFGDKNINQAPIKEIIDSTSKKTESKLKNHKETVKPKTEVHKIENNGNLSIGQTGGVVNQTTILNSNPKPAARQMTSNLIQDLIEKIPSNFIVEVGYPYLDEESTNFANEIINSLNKSGYRIARSMYGQVIPDLNESYLLRLDEKEEKAVLTVYKLK